LNAEQLEFISQTFSALADPTRARIVFALIHNVFNVSALADLVDVSASAVSHHLARLRNQRLVRSHRQGNQVFYSLDDDHIANLFAEALSHLDHIRSILPKFPEAQKNHIKAKGNEST
jgi:DNA-binding transcriptional ArsR family regulator